ncbi:phage tail assembly chaperone [Aminobacter sp. HY435]|uniref:phage tail assembly chaperone n=1 Tax=Aminobacter sp. HY435 TaxID=2970917 RepID=UPI003FA4D313
MAAGFGLLRLSPASFWAMTPRELERAMSVLSQGRGNAPLRVQLETLMAAFPDNREPNHG